MFGSIVDYIIQKSLFSLLRLIFFVTDMVMYKYLSPFCFIDRMQDIELMHMRYALESAVLALRAMERSTDSGRESHPQEPFCVLKDLQSHLEAITNIPRKVK